MKKRLSKIEIEFLDHSNRMEGVRDKQSLEDAKDAWRFIKTKREISLATMLKAHKILMKNQPLASHHKGALRNCPVYIGGHEPTPWENVKTELAIWTLTWTVRGDPLQMHIIFEHIHPFVDGNGRLGRILMNWHYLKQKKPPKVIHEGIEQYQYYKMF